MTLCKRWLRKFINYADHGTLLWTSAWLLFRSFSAMIYTLLSWYWPQAVHIMYWLNFKKPFHITCFLIAPKTVLISISSLFLYTQRVEDKAQFGRKCDKQACLDYFVFVSFRSCQTNIEINDELVSKAATVFHCYHAVSNPLLSCCHGKGLMAVPSEQMVLKNLFGTSEGSPILATGSSSSCCLKTLFWVLTAI